MSAGAGVAGDPTTVRRSTHIRRAPGPPRAALPFGVPTAVSVAPVASAGGRHPSASTASTEATFRARAVIVAWPRLTGSSGVAAEGYIPVAKWTSATARAGISIDLAMRGWWKGSASARRRPRAVGLRADSPGIAMTASSSVGGGSIEGGGGPGVNGTVGGVGSSGAKNDNAVAEAAARSHTRAGLAEA